jgi:hypothetical protein
MATPHEAPTLPPLPLKEWEDTKETLHRYCQIVGKVRREYSPYRNHWWHVTLYVTTRGLSTGPIPYGRTTFDISFDLLENRLAVTTGEGAFSFALDDLPVAEFYRRLFEGLRSLEGTQQQLSQRDPAGVPPERLRGGREDRGLGHGGVRSRRRRLTRACTTGSPTCGLRCSTL